MTENIYFFDTYALFEIFRKNIKYLMYIDVNIVTAKINLFELYYGLLKEFGEKTAQEKLHEYFGSTVDFDEEVIENAAKFKLKNKSRKLSMADCIGYSIANKLGIKFLTGDKEFEKLENVEFVK
ncbi:MAG: PIN domain-containing protein [Nanoarchaeota archaeon]